jgi:hypothetical protein
MPSIKTRVVASIELIAHAIRSFEAIWYLAPRSAYNATGGSLCDT